MTLWHMSVMNLTSNSISLVHTHQDLMAKQKILTNFLKPQFANSVRKTMLHGIKCLTRSYSHTDVVLTLQLVKHHIPCSISETHPYQFTKLIQPLEPYKGDDPLPKQIEKTQIALSIAVKWLGKKRENQKRHYKNRKSTHTFKVCDLVLLRKHNKDKLELKWEPNYRIIKLPHKMSAIVDNQFTGRTKRCNITD